MGIIEALSGFSRAPVAWAPHLAGVLAKGTVLLLVVCGAAVALRRASAGVRHLVWSIGLAGVLVLPVAAALPWRLEVLPGPIGWSAAGGEAAAGGAPAGDPVGVAAPAARGTGAWREWPLPSPEMPFPAVPEGASAGVSLAAEGAAEAEGVEVQGEAAAVGGAAGGRSWPAREGVLAVLLLAWFSGAAALLAYIAGGAVLVRRIARRAAPLDSPDWTTPLYEAADRLDLDDAPRLLLSDEVSLPFTYGLFRPAIVLPRAAGDWSDERRRAVLFHELGHVRRFDLLSHLVGRIACAIYWFHPLVWLAARRARAECERACDDLVLNAGTRASAYADHLLQIVCGAARTSAPAVAIPMAQRREFEGRMLAILEPEVRRDAPSRAQAAVVGAAVAALALTVAAAAPARTGVPVAAAPDSEAPGSPAGEAAGAAGAAGHPPAAPDSRYERNDRGAGAAPAAETAAPSGYRPAGRGWWLAGGIADALDGEGAEAAAVPADTDRVTPGYWYGYKVDPDGLSAMAGTLEATAGAVVGSVVGSVLGTLGGLGAIDGWPMPMPTPTPAPTPHIRAWKGRGHDEPAATIAGGWQKAQPADSAAVAALIAALDDSVASVRTAAAYALGELGDEMAAAALARVVRRDADAGVRRIAAWALGEIGDPAAVAALGDAVRSDADREVRRTAAWALGEIGSADAVPALGVAVRSGDTEVKSMATWALGEIQPERAPAPLVAALEDKDAGVRRMAAWALGQIADPEAAPALARALEDADDGVRRTALWALGEMGGETARNALLRAIRSADPEIRRMAAQALARTY